MFPRNSVTRCTAEKTAEYSQLLCDHRIAFISMLANLILIIACWKHIVKILFGRKIERKTLEQTWTKWNEEKEKGIHDASMDRHNSKEWGDYNSFAIIVQTRTMRDHITHTNTGMP